LHSAHEELILTEDGRLLHAEESTPCGESAAARRHGPRLYSVLVGWVA
jgi:hypothetical protein